MVFLDTNIFVRFLTNDSPELTPKCTALFQSIYDGTIEAQTNACVIHETCYVLCSSRLYQLERNEVSRRLKELLSYPKLLIAEKGYVFAALDLFGATQLDFTDCLIAKTMQEEFIDVVYSYDKGFDSLDWVMRKEP